jgi:hypothetical protein
MNGQLADASPWIVATLTSLASLLFGLPPGVAISAAGGAYWAWYRSKSSGFIYSLLLIVSGVFVACIFVEGVQWVFEKILNIPDIPQRPLAFILGFAAIDEKFRKRLIDWFAARFDTVEVKKHD